MSLPKRNSADGRCYWMKPEVQEELQPLFDQCIQDAIDGRITRLDSLWPPVVVSSEGAPFEVWQLLRTWTEAQRAETLDAEKAIAFSENLRRQSRWGEIDYYLFDLLKRELQEKYFGRLQKALRSLDCSALHSLKRRFPPSSRNFCFMMGQNGVCTLRFVPFLWGSHLDLWLSFQGIRQRMYMACRKRMK